MRNLMLATTGLAALSLAACEQPAAEAPEEEAEAPAAEQPEEGEGAPGEAAGMAHADLSGLYDAVFLLDFTEGEGPSPVNVPEGLDWAPDGDAYILSGSVEGEPASSGFTDGVALEIPHGTAVQLGGQTVEVTVVASADPASEFAAAYTTNDGEDSGWHRFEAGPDPQHFRFEYDVPAIEAGSGDYIGLVPTGGNPVNIHGVAVEIVETEEG